MNHGQPLELILNDSLRTVAAPAELWERVWQPRFRPAAISWKRAFAFSLPLAAAMALITLVAIQNPLHSQTATPQFAGSGKPGLAGLVTAVSRTERRETVRTVVGDRLRQSGRAESAETQESAACALCHTL
jgi:hypothetical protein